MNQITQEAFNDIMTSLYSNDETFCIEAKDSLGDLDKIWQTISALSNAASFYNKPYAYMIWWLEDASWAIKGTTFDPRKKKRQWQDWWLYLESRLWFRNIMEDYEYIHEWVRLYILKIKKCGNSPLNFVDIPYIKINSHNQLLNKYPKYLTKILIKLEDRSSQICEWAILDDLDLQAIQKARALYLVKNPNKAEELSKRDDITFLNKAKVIIQWKITNTAILLLGKLESDHFLSPAISKISWILKDRDGREIDYQHFGCPFIISIEDVYKKIRNLKYRYIADTTLFPEEVDKYDPYIVREALNNCIAHQDYMLAGKINIVENEDSLIFANMWSFIPKTIQNVIDWNSPTEYYRNRFLVDAMVNLNMIDTIWSGIRKMFEAQSKKFFPLPEYDISDENVSVTIIWKVLDIRYARKLAQIKNLSLNDIIVLDAIQKKKTIDTEIIKKLKWRWIIEWRSPNFYISANVAEQIDQVWDYIMHKADIDEQRNKVFKLISLYKDGISKDWIKIFLEKNKILEEWLSSNKKNNRLQNILTHLKKEGKIDPVWSWNKSLRKVVL